MADINVPLLVALGDRAAPQHKVRGQEAFEFSEGSDGALHTKIVDQNGNPISSSNKLQVADIDVKAELEQIKQQQQQILQRLNQPIDTQLTGSNTVYILFDALALTDTNRVISQIFDISGLSRFYLFVRSTIDVEVRLGIRVRMNKNEATNAVMFWNGQQYETTFPTNNTGLPISDTQNAWILLNSRYEWINNIIASDIAIQLMATQVPTTGSISVYLVGRS